MGGSTRVGNYNLHPFDMRERYFKQSPLQRIMNVRCEIQTKKCSKLDNPPLCFSALSLSVVVIMYTKIGIIVSF